MQVTQECLALGIEQAVKGNRVKDISRSVYDHAREAGYGVVRDYCGHGTGFAVHEEPQIPNYVGRDPIHGSSPAWCSLSSP